MEKQMNLRHIGKIALSCAIFCSTVMFAQEGRRQPPLPANPLPYDLLLAGGHVLDDKNKVDGMRDVGIKDGKIVAVGEHLNPKDALKMIDVKGLYVAPGLIDLHTHVYTGTGERGSYAGDLSVYPDGFTLRNGVTTIVDHRSLEDARSRGVEHRRLRYARCGVREQSR
jgi:dihydroorotase